MMTASTSTTPPAGANRDRPGFAFALATCRAGETVAVTSWRGVTGALADVPAIVTELTGKMARLSMGGTIHDPANIVGRLLFNVSAMHRITHTVGQTRLWPNFWEELGEWTTPAMPRTRRPQSARDGRVETA
jgi:hypothetical protein